MKKTSLLIVGDASVSGMSTSRLRLVASLCLAFGSALVGHAREWTSQDGRKLTADLVSSSGGQVTLKRSDGAVFTLPLARLSAADQAFVLAQAKPAAAPALIDERYAALITGDWALSEHKGLPFALYAPKDLNDSQRYPLILALHGKSPNNDNGKQVGGWMKSFTTPDRLANNPCIIVAPLCYQPFGETGSGWGDKPGDQAVALVKDLVKSLPVDPGRVYCIGYSMGGFGVCHLIDSERRLFAAGIAVAGCSGPDTASTFKKVPLWLFHAADDAVVKVDRSRALAEALKKFAACKYTEYPTGGHGIIGKVFEDRATHDWLFSQTMK